MTYQGTKFRNTVVAVAFSLLLGSVVLTGTAGAAFGGQAASAPIAARHA